ncbi:uncharacterized protein SPPG_02048 [Spizellomyces punctatus DAOM BR117]|uniref:Polynucleotide adenylyltransferase n=1 Tax=Spizellomyces punctatus (strain DAOM BR117) TaxID=645134 RepID=A0A0L0HPI9_SPIPD|nr:uncharacterized protein SPPG_02048 [Spizellomyces punctatus DAOM BR117]KND02973.1 hypothetical protein SPPG_02048 [Spizellomyces punctatus DAOM BR117]|eukprot:XP_016611012.1 hypothetical protein SPPG_02048 [Spizellomyces punctatus DAOM BR117]
MLSVAMPTVDPLTQWANRSLEKLGREWLKSPNSLLDKSYRPVIESTANGGEHSDLANEDLPELPGLPLLHTLPPKFDSRPSDLFAKLNNEIILLAAQLNLRPQERALRGWVVRQLRTFLKDYCKAKQLRPGAAKAHLIGSSRYGGCLPTSGLDIMIEFDLELEQNENLLGDLHDALLVSPLIQKVANLSTLKINRHGSVTRYIQFCTRMGSLKVFLYLNCPSALKAADAMQRAMLDLQPHLYPLTLVVKQWFHIRGFSKTDSGGVSGFAVVNMVLALVLRFEKLTRDTSPLARLFVQYFQFFGFDFTPDLHAICCQVEEGVCMKKARAIDKWNGNPEGQSISNFQVIDPSDYLNDMTSRAFKFSEIRGQCQDSSGVLKLRYQGGVFCDLGTGDMLDGIVRGDDDMVRHQRDRFCAEWNDYLNDEIGVSLDSMAVDVPSSIHSPAQHPTAVTFSGMVTQPATMIDPISDSEQSTSSQRQPTRKNPQPSNARKSELSVKVDVRPIGSQTIRPTETSPISAEEDMDIDTSSPSPIMTQTAATKSSTKTTLPDSRVVEDGAPHALPEAIGVTSNADCGTAQLSPIVIEDMDDKRPQRMEPPQLPTLKAYIDNYYQTNNLPRETFNLPYVKNTSAPQLVNVLGATSFRTDRKTSTEFERPRQTNKTIECISLLSSPSSAGSGPSTASLRISSESESEEGAIDEVPRGRRSVSPVRTKQSRREDETEDRNRVGSRGRHSQSRTTRRHSRSRSPRYW